MVASAVNVLWGGGLAGVGFAPEQGAAIDQYVQSNVAAVGSILSNTTSSPADIVVLTSVASNNNGLKLRRGNYSRRQIVINATSTTANIYPAAGTSGSINNRAAGTAISLASGQAGLFIELTSNQHWAIIS